MRLHACVLATAAVLATAPQLAGARTPGPAPSRPPGPAWTPGAAVTALARVVARGVETLPQLEGLCVPRPFGLSLPAASLAALSELGDLGARCELAASTRWPLMWRPLDLDGLALVLQVELRDIVAGPAGLLARWLPDAPAADFLPDLTALTTSPVRGGESSGFGWRRDPIGRHAKFHKGTDFRAKHGTPVYAAGAGRVVFLGQQRGYGNIVYLDHGGGVVTRYAHLSRFETARGEVVPEGQLIGRVGATGRATGPHLHFEVRLGDRAVEPKLAMQIGALQRTDPAAARAAAAQLAAEIQDHKIDRHDPPGRARRVDRKPRGSRPERAGGPRRVRLQS